MYSWERRAAENLTNAEHICEVRKRRDLKYEDHLRRQEQERADAEVRREVHRVRTPSPTPQTNRFKARRYERPWAQGAPGTKKSSSSVKSTRSEMRNSQNKGSESRFPAISSGTQSSVTQSRTAELATTSKTWRRAIAPLASHCKEQSPPCHKHRSVAVKNRACKLSTCATKSNTLKLTQSQDTLRVKKKIGAPSCDRADSSNISTRHDMVKRPLDSCSLPQPLTFSRRSYTDGPRLPSLQYHRSPSPDDPESHPYVQLISDPFQGYSESSSITEEYVRSEDTYRAELCSRSLADTSPLSVPESLPSQCPSSSGTLESSSLSLSDSFTGPLSSHFRTLGVLSSESESDGEDDSHSCQDADRESYQIPVRWTASQSPSVRTVRSPRGLQSQLSLESTSTPEESPNSRASYTGEGYSPMPSLMQVGRLSISPLSITPSVTQRASRALTIPQQLYDHLPELDHLSPLSPRRANPIWLGSERWPVLEASPPRTSYTLRHSQLVSRIQQEEPEEVRGEASSSDSSTEDTPSSSEASRHGTSGLMDHLTMALMALRDIRREVAHIQMSNAQEGSGAMAAQEAQSAPATNPETLRKIKERLLEESSDEEEGDQCRICQCGAGSLTNPLLTPCLCSGSLQYIHHDCLKRWIQTKIQSGTTLSAVKTCELCKGSLTLDLDDFDMEEFYQRHGQTQVEQTSPELYMLLILRQRFSELLQVAQSRSNAVSRV